LYRQKESGILAGRLPHKYAEKQLAAAGGRLRYKIMSAVKKIKQDTHNAFLNFYELEAEGRTGNDFPYYMVSRMTKPENLEINQPKRRADGVIVFALYGSDRIVLVRQYRYPLGRRIYELPAGLIDDGENPREAAIREMKEETGLTFRPVHTDPLFENPAYTTAGMTDEKCVLVCGYAEGEPDEAGLELTEDIEVVIADRPQARRILREESCALPCAYMLIHFISGGDPFAFLSADSSNGNL